MNYRLTDWLTDLLTSMPEMLRHLKICFWWVGQYLESNVLCLTVLKSWVHSLHQDCHQHHHPSCPHFHRYHDHHHSVKKLVVFSWKLVARVACWGEQQGGRHVFWELQIHMCLHHHPASAAANILTATMMISFLLSRHSTVNHSR